MPHRGALAVWNPGGEVSFFFGVMNGEAGIFSLNFAGNPAF
jgi:hypothetical protein